MVYAVEFSHRSGRDLVNMAKKRTNVIPIIEDARHPSKYRMLVGMVDVIFSDVAQPDQVCSLSVFLREQVIHCNCDTCLYQKEILKVLNGLNRGKKITNLHRIGCVAPAMLAWLIPIKKIALF